MEALGMRASSGARASLPKAKWCKLDPGKEPQPSSQPHTAPWPGKEQALARKTAYQSPSDHYSVTLGILPVKKLIMNESNANAW